MCGIVDLYTIERNLSTHLVEQIRGIKREFLGFRFPTTRMCNDGDSSTAMYSLYRLRYIHLEFAISRITDLIITHNSRDLREMQKSEKEPSRSYIIQAS